MGPMVETMARTCTARELETYADFNLGLWQNVLALAPRDEAVIEIVHVAWNVTREARRVVEWSIERRRRARRRAEAEAAAAALTVVDAAAPVPQPTTPTTPTRAASS